MPFKNCQQQKAIFAKNPELGKKWVSKYGSVCGNSDTEMRAKNDHLRKKKK